MSSPGQAQSQPAARAWAASMCQALGPTLGQLGALNDAMTQLNATNPNEVSAMGPAFGAAGNAVSLVGTLTSDPQLRAAIDQTAECQNVPGMHATASSPSQPPS